MTFAKWKGERAHLKQSEIDCVWKKFRTPQQWRSSPVPASPACDRFSISETPASETGIYREPGRTSAAWRQKINEAACIINASSSLAGRRRGGERADGRRSQS